MSNLSLTIGATFNGRYRVVRCMAHGGMGAVYEVIHLETERRRALKVMLPHLVQSPELRDRFRQEARVAAKIESKYIVDVFDAGIDDQTGMPFLVMELLKGEELGKRLERLKRLPAKEVVKYLQQTASALDKTHGANIVHRDLKPENLFLHEQEDEEPRIKVLDFGIAKIVAEHGTQANATRSVGTPLYMAPEQFKQGSHVSPATDIYALGMMAYTLLVGRPYWEDEQRANDNVFAFVGSVMHGPKEKATVRAERRGVVLAPAFDTWFSKVTNPVPQQRYASAKEAIAGLAEALGLQAPEASRILTALEAVPVESLREQSANPPTDPQSSQSLARPAIPPARPPLVSHSGTALLPMPTPPENSPGAPPESAPEPPNPPLSPTAPRSTPNTGPAQTGAEGVSAVAMTRPTGTPPKKRNAAVVFVIVGVVALVGIGAAMLGGRSEKTETSNGSLPPKSIESITTPIATSTLPPTSNSSAESFEPQTPSTSAAMPSSASAKPVEQNRLPAGSASAASEVTGNPPGVLTYKPPTAVPASNKDRDPRARINKRF